MQMCRSRGTARQNKRGQGRKLRIQAVDVALEAFDLARQHPQPFGLALTLGHREIGAKVEQIILDQAQHRIELTRLRQMKPDKANGGVGLIDGPVGSNTQVVFRTAFAAAKRRGAVISGSRVNTIEDDHTSLL
jgi:hypothetical protein